MVKHTHTQELKISNSSLKAAEKSRKETFKKIYIHIYRLLENGLKESKKNNKSIYMFVKDIYI